MDVNFKIITIPMDVNINIIRIGYLCLNDYHTKTIDKRKLYTENVFCVSQFAFIWYFFMIVASNVEPLSRGVCAPLLP